MKFTIYFDKCGEGFQVKCAVERDPPLGTYYGILKYGRIMNKTKALDYAKKHVIYRKSTEQIQYEYVIDETGLSA